MSVVGRPVLSRDVIAEVALRLTETDGLATLSMRKLGAELGVEAMSLYHYVENKNDLLQAMTDRLYAEIELPDLADDVQWDDAVRQVLRSYHRVLVRHSAATELFFSQAMTATGGLPVMTWVFELFTRIGLEASDAGAALHFAVSFASGHAATELSGNESLVVDPTAIGAIGDPAVALFVGQLSDADPDELFEAGLELVIAGFRSRFQLP
ncbi:MAG: TetR/AcrR family transcriptional regulator C-terminal domain-containing protein [Acidimicrobiales bacterium]